MPKPEPKPKEFVSSVVIPELTPPLQPEPGPKPKPYPEVMAVVHRMGVTLMTLSTLQMWQEAGFLQRAFSPFKAAPWHFVLTCTLDGPMAMPWLSTTRDLGMSIALVATS